MTKDTASESTGGMASTAVLVCRHMVERLTNRRNPIMTGVTSITDNVRGSMIDEGALENIGVMAAAAIRVC